MLLDFVDVTTTHNLVSLPTLFGLNRGLNMEGLSLLNLMDKVEALRRAKTLLNLDSATEAVQLIGWAESVDLFGAEHGQTFLHILESIPLRKGFGSWHDQAPYPSQLMMCEWNHITVPLGATRGQVAAVLNEVIGRRQRAQRPDLYKETRDVSQ